MLNSIWNIPNWIWNIVKFGTLSVWNPTIFQINIAIGTVNTKMVYYLIPCIWIIVGFRHVIPNLIMFQVNMICLEYGPNGPNTPILWLEKKYYSLLLYLLRILFTSKIVEVMSQLLTNLYLLTRFIILWPARAGLFFR